MNIFVLDLDPKKCAEYHCDKHLIKMIVEHNQILGSIAYTARGISSKKEINPDFVKTYFNSFPRRNLEGDSHPYGIGYKNHPCTQWAARSKQNYNWLCDLNLEMCKEYTKRYGKIHSGKKITEWYAYNQPKLSDIGMTPFAQAMPDECKNPNAVIAYRSYYIKYKSRFAKWKTKIPSWYIID